MQQPSSPLLCWPPPQRHHPTSSLPQPPQHHAAALHLADHYKRWGRLAPCFTHERFHKLAKSYASTRRNTTSYERGIIEDIAVSQICSNEEATFGFIGLVKPVKPSKKGMQRFRDSPLIPPRRGHLNSPHVFNGFCEG